MHHSSAAIGTGSSRPTRNSARMNNRACIDCHRRKVRCDVVDNGLPCSNCKQRNRTDCCIYEKKRYRSRDQPVKPRTIRPLTAQKARSSPSPIVHTPSRSTASDEDENERDPGNLDDLFNREDIRCASIGHRGRMCFVGTDVSNFNYLVRQSLQTPCHASLIHFGARQYHRKDTSHDVHNIPPDALARLPKAVEMKLIRAYFEHVNPGWPIVDENYFMKQYENDVDAQNPLALPLLNAILLVGAHTLTAKDKSMRPLLSIFFRRAKKLIEYRYEQDRTVYVQSALLMTWYSDGHEDILANTWYWLGFASRVAIGHGMHRDVTHSKMIDCHKRLWTRLWWVLFQLDTVVSASYGRPQVLNLDESDVPDLQPSHFEGIPNAEIDFVIQHARLCAIISRVMRKRWALRAPPEERIEASRQADDALARFTLELPQTHHLSFSNLSPWTATLHLTYNNFVILLHRPPPKHSLSDLVSEACTDLTLCGTSTILIASILETLRHRTELSSLWLWSVHTLFTATIHVGNELSSNNAIAAAKARRTFDSLMESLKVLSQSWRFAESVLQLFQQRAPALRASFGMPNPTTETLYQHTTPIADRPAGEFSRRPEVHKANLHDASEWTQPTHKEDQPSVDTNLEQPEGIMATPLKGFDFSLTDDMMLDSSFPNIPALETFLAGMESGILDF